MATVVHAPLTGRLSGFRTNAVAAPASSSTKCSIVNASGKIGFSGCTLKSNLVSPSLRTGPTACSSVRVAAMVADLKTKSTAPEVAASENLLRFVKYHGLGNDFILVDNRKSSTLCISPEQAATLCDRNFGVGGDGVIFVLPGVNGSDYTMRIINSDGSEPEMCGNGIRCMAKFIAELEGTTEPRSYKIDTLAGLIVPELMPDGQVCVDMGPPILEAKQVPTTLEPTRDGAVIKAPLVVAGRSWSVTCVSMGNPHCVVLLDASEDVYSLPLAEIGPLFEKNEVFPARINTEFVQVLSSSHLRMRVWERGAGPTLACGTGACALVVAAVLEGRAERSCLVELPGGPLQIEWRESDNHVYMTGPAQIAFRGTAYLYS
ncbi:hypothetical protein R1flu_021032 [Riccia fluitans]|uniref:diaminopimelate epimerase n=1 Tax=Riccia fluitans TaxID=41844 RepID=A0ABD1ZN70_9MARC